MIFKLSYTLIINFINLTLGKVYGTDILMEK